MSTSAGNGQAKIKVPAWLKVETRRRVLQSLRHVESFSTFVEHALDLYVTERGGPPRGSFQDKGPRLPSGRRPQEEKQVGEASVEKIKVNIVLTADTRARVVSVLRPTEAFSEFVENALLRLIHRRKEEGSQQE